MKINVIKESTKGNFRASNQDRVNYDFNEYGQFIAVLCDGMGGHPFGDVAAQVASEEFVKLFKKTDFAEMDKKEVINWIRLSILAIKNTMLAMAEQKGEILDMGTTLSALLVIDIDEAYVINIGDSRIYHNYKNKTKLLTVDQNLLNSTKPADRKRINKNHEEDPNFNEFHYWKILTSVLGPTKKIRVDVDLEKNTKGLFLLTTDGVHDYLSDKELNGILSSDLTLEEKADTLIETAQKGHSTDNLSLILLEITGEE
ncbi:PP2C family protein-serine/threonine phosphatase [Mesoplasma lactucae]|uniref:Protein phosphatase n=1 Tax=Mesoplasma lactucae ATCC 49193 TaxID=81460 RepID=A0A291IS04_9MOLU|nr:PP2C family serine/threonine-protein phosphatase [Mesoplasma lactucae]ATG97540.1 protein phosphatase [Mesoplasma lactucae ATCC 49193]ATZ20002.1 phosphorylated protein phosphatase [Mesoplasma lactucae ATCC 49193]MCL8217047.1 Serine/threonine phosphatase stp [Mesoplasma lactucae ATCC 49193]